LESPTTRKGATHVTTGAEATTHMAAAAEATGMAATAATAAMTATTATTAAASKSAGGHRGRSQSQGSDEDDCSVQVHLPHGTYFLSITELTRRDYRPLECTLALVFMRECARFVPHTSKRPARGGCAVLAGVRRQLRNSAATRRRDQASRISFSAKRRHLRTFRTAVISIRC
jgi:hypothetical protein